MGGLDQRLAVGHSKSLETPEGTYEVYTLFAVCIAWDLHSIAWVRWTKCHGKEGSMTWLF